MTTTTLPVATLPPPPSGPVQRVHVIDLLRGVAALGLAAGLTWWLIPRLTTTSWTGIVDLMMSLTILKLAALSALWAIGLVLHSSVLTASLPGLSHRRALTLNLTGSAVSNLLPGGGAAGVATNLMMMRRWSVPTVSFTAFTLVSNAWDVAAKLLLPVVAVVLVLFGEQVPPSALLGGAAVAALGLVGAAAALIALRRLPEPTGAPDSAAVGPVRRLLHRGVAATRGALPMAVQTASTGWPRLTIAMATYMAAQAALLWACLAALGSPVAVTAVVAAFAVERLTTLIPVTPAGFGLAEAGAVTVLVAMGCAPAPAAAGVLLYRLFTVVLEVPVGAVWLAGWSQLTTTRRRSLR